jgi:Zn-dependent protease with chaperone function
MNNQEHVRLEEMSQRDLFAAIREVADALGEAMPSAVYLVNEVNAWVTHRGGALGLGQRRVMGLGLPLLQGLTVGELKAVIAHEYAHCAAGGIGTPALQNIGDRLISSGFTSLGRRLLRSARSISRQQEFFADAVAARTVSPQAMASALRRTEGLAAAFDAYWHAEVVPALEAGCLPPITTGFQQYLEADHVSAAVRRLVRASESETEADAFDTHPPLRDRLAALARIVPQHAAPVHDPPAAGLLCDAEALARSLVAFATGAERSAKLRRVGWNDLATDVYSKRWRKAAAQASPFLAGYTLADLPTGRDAFIAAGAELLPSAAAGDELKFRYAVHVFSMGVGTALLDAGFTPHTGPGHPVVFRKRGVRIRAFDDVEQLAEGTMTLADWQARCCTAGIAGLSLGLRPAA